MESGWVESLATLEARSSWAMGPEPLWDDELLSLDCRNDGAEDACCSATARSWRAAMPFSIDSVALSSSPLSASFERVLPTVLLLLPVLLLLLLLLLFVVREDVLEGSEIVVVPLFRLHRLSFRMSARELLVTPEVTVASSKTDTTSKSDAFLPVQNMGVLPLLSRRMGDPASISILTALKCPS
jgi:hypothetical protein